MDVSVCAFLSECVFVCLCASISPELHARLCRMRSDYSSRYTSRVVVAAYRRAANFVRAETHEPAVEWHHAVQIGQLDTRQTRVGDFCVHENTTDTFCQPSTRFMKISISHE